MREMRERDIERIERCMKKKRMYENEKKREMR